MKRAELEWRGDTPVSRQFGDVYYNPEDGAGESRHVFLEGNHIPRRWAAARSDGVFHLGEIGFGTGLNFLVTLAHYRRQRPAARLAYYTTEQFPLAVDDLRRALRAFGELREEADLLLAAYPDAVAGMHRIVLEQGRVTLNVLYGDAIFSLGELSGRHFDAWYLDGFAPSKNPELWTAELAGQVARLSRPGATASTFSVAGAVRRALQGAGFAIEKTPGFGRKREMLVGRLIEADTAVQPLSSPRRDHDDSVLVIGGGLAGTAMVEALTRRGKRAILIERESQIASGASGNGAGLAFPWLTAEPTHLSRLSLVAFAYLRGHLQRMQAIRADFPFEHCGVLQLFFTPAIARRLERALAVHGLPEDVARIVDPPGARELAGVPIQVGALYFPGGVLLSPRLLCAAQLDAARETGLLQEVYRRAAIRIESTATGWRVLDENENEIATGRDLVLCAADETKKFAPTDWLPLRRVRGQVMRAPADAASSQLKRAVCYDGYVTPVVAALQTPGEHWIGATFEEWNENVELAPEQNRWLFEKAAQWLPEWCQSLGSSSGERAAQPGHTGQTEQTAHGAPPVEAWPGRVAFRSASRDRFPIIGRVPDRERGLELLAARETAMRQGEISVNDVLDDAVLPGLFVSTAHGSRGILTAPLGAELIASQICEEARPVAAELESALDPRRFLLRELRIRSKGR